MKTVWLVVPAVQSVSVLLPDRRQVNFFSGTVMDSVTGLHPALSEIFEG